MYKKSPWGAGTHTENTREKRYRGEPEHTDTRDTRISNLTTNPTHQNAHARPDALSPGKRHRGEPGHTHAGHTRDTRAHTGTRSTHRRISQPHKGNLTTTQTHTLSPVKRHRGEPGHTRDTQAHLRAHTDHTDHTDEPHHPCIQTHQRTHTHARPRDDRMSAAELNSR